MRKTVVWLVLAVVAGALAAGFYYVGPPADARARRFDLRRETDLQRLRLAADLYWTRNHRLPASLDELAKEAGTDIYGSDPESGEPYRYAVKAEDVYELCADFARESEEGGDFWSHGAGTRCYTVTAKPVRPR